MIYILFSVLWGALIALILSSPYSYYPIFISILIVSIIVFVIFKKSSIKQKKYKIVFPICMLIISYTICTYIIFKPSTINFSSNNKINKNKTAVIFYCEGEMEKYTPYYSKDFIGDIPLIKKPFDAYMLKRTYRQIGTNNKNAELIKVALDLKNSIINYKPYYFYIGFSDYSPSFEKSLSSAIADGCGKIIVINYSDKDNIKGQINIDSINKCGVNIVFTKPVFESKNISDVMVSRISNLPNKPDGILLIDKGSPVSESIKEALISLGYQDNQIIISDKITSSMNSFKESNFKNILYINIRESGNGIYSEVICPDLFQKYQNDFKIYGIKSWGYDKKLVKAALDSFLEVEDRK